MPTVDQLLVQIDASTELLRRELQKGADGVERFRRDTEKHLGGMEAAFGKLKNFVRQALGVFGVALSVQWAANFAKQTVLAMDALGDLAKQLNISVESFQRLEYAFGRAGVDAGRFQQALRQLNIRLGQFQSTGKGPLVDVFAKLGIDPKSVKNAEDMLLKMAAAWDKAGTEAQQANLLRQAAGRGAEVLGPALAQGAAKLQTEMEDATVWTANQTRAADNLVDAWGRLVNKGKALTGVMVELAAIAGEELGIDELGSSSRTAQQEVEKLRSELELLDSTWARIAAAAATRGGLPAAAVGTVRGLMRRDVEERLAAAERQARLEAMDVEFAAPIGPVEPPLSQEDVDLVEKWHKEMRTADERTADTVLELQRLAAAVGGLSPEDLKRALASLAPKIEKVTELDVMQNAFEQTARWTEKFSTELDRAQRELENMLMHAELLKASWPEGTEAIRQQRLEVERLKKETESLYGDEAFIAVKPQRVASAEEMSAAAEARRAAVGGLRVSPVTDEMLRSLEEYNELAERAKQRQEEFADSIAATFESRGMEALLSGDISAGIRGFTQDLVELIFRITVLQPLAEELAGTLGGVGGLGNVVSGGGLLGKWFPKIFGAAASGVATGGQDLGALISQMAAGGPVSANKPYVVGEEGAELFVPDVPGRIVPSGRGTRSGGGTTIVQQFHVQAGLPPQWEAQLVGVGQMAARSAYSAVNKKLVGER